MSLPPEITTLVFDLGDTLIAVDPKSTGPISSRPELHPIPGIRSALSALKGSFRLAIASNIGDSMPSQVQKALERAGLEGFFDQIFTSAEIGLEKPDPAYFFGVARS